MTLLVFFICLSIGVSFLCSMLEAVILSVTPSYLSSLKSSKPKLYRDVEHLKSDIEKPLASILTFNTIAHTIGAAGAGAQAQVLFGNEFLAIFTAVLTFAILFFSEIIPKSLGASSWKALLPFSARVLKPMIWISYPLVWLSIKVSKTFKGEPEVVTRDEISAMADIGLSDGVLKSSEHRALKGVVQFDTMKISEAWTPKERVQSISYEASLDEAYQQMKEHPFSRVIVFDEKGGLKGYVLRTKLQKSYIEQKGVQVADLVLPLLCLKPDVSLQLIFQSLLRRREHICAITDDSGDFLGIVTLEDLIEHMLDLEIFDEQDHLIPD